MATPFPEDVPVVVRVLRDVVRARAAEFEAECTESGPAEWVVALGAWAPVDGQPARVVRNLAK